MLNNQPIAAPLQLDTTCAACNGGGMVQDAAWAAWFDGGQTGPEPSGPEETPCGECDGVGTAPTPFGLALLHFVARYHADWHPQRVTAGPR